MMEFGYPHWLMTIGVLLVGFGVSGLIHRWRKAARRNQLPMGLRH